MKTEPLSIDALAMSRRLRIHTGAKLRAMSREERLVYLHRRLKLFRSRLRRQQAPTPALSHR